MRSASKLFARRVRDAGGAAKVAALLGCTRAYVYLLVAGEGRPSLDLARVIEDRFGVPMRAWTDPARPRN